MAVSRQTLAVGDPPAIDGSPQGVGTEGGWGEGIGDRVLSFAPIGHVAIPRSYIYQCHSPHDHELGGSLGEGGWMYMTTLSPEWGMTLTVAADRPECGP